MKNTKFLSLRLPFGMYVHYAGGRKIGESRPAYDKGLVHYNRRRKLTVKTVRSFFGEPNHYDSQGKCVGYSRCGGLGKIVHYDRNGDEIGYTYHFLHLVYFHRISKSSSLWLLPSKPRKTRLTHESLNNFLEVS